MPFNWRTPFGYVITCSLQCLAWYFLLANCSVILVFLGGVCWFLMTFIGDINEDFHSLNTITKDSMKFKKKLYRIIKFHTDVIQLSHIFKFIFDKQIKLECSNFSLDWHVIFRTFMNSSLVAIICGAF